MRLHSTVVVPSRAMLTKAPGRSVGFWPGGTAGAAFYTFEQPGIYAYVNHNLIEAFELGAAAHFTVTGDWNDDLMTSVLAPSAS